MNRHAKKLLKLYRKDPNKFFARYKNMNMTHSVINLLYRETETFISNSNGVGSPSGGWFSRLIYNITPSTIWFMSIKRQADIHDNGYSVPIKFETEKAALEHKAIEDYNFHHNIEREIKRKGGFLLSLRFLRLAKYDLVLYVYGKRAFLKGKIIGGHGG